MNDDAPNRERGPRAPSEASSEAPKPKSPKIRVRTSLRAGVYVERMEFEYKEFTTGPRHGRGS
jgi:hypothetical protein